MLRIGVNCGHTVSGTTGCGAVGRIDESVETRAVGNKLMLLLSKAGYTVYDCTNDYAGSVNANLNKIVEMANKQPLDLFVSIHFNSGGGRGVEVFTYGGKQYTEAVDVCKSISALGFTNRGVKDGSKLAVVRRSNAKAMLVEVCFVDTDDADLYMELGADRIAEALCDAITGSTEPIENTETESGELTMSQYTELKNEIEALKKEFGQHKDDSAWLEKANGKSVYDYVDAFMPSWSHEAVKWCLDKKLIFGDEDGKLNLNNTKIWVCVVLHRFASLLGKA